MYEEIDKSDQSKWNACVATAFVIIVGLALIIVLGLPTDLVGFQSSATVGMVIFCPFIGMILGSAFGFLRKRTIKINVDRLEFTERTETQEEFGTAYYEEGYSTGELGGSPCSGCIWFLVLVMTPFTGFVVLMSSSIITNQVAIFLTVPLIAIFYIIGLKLGYNASPIKSKLVSNPTLIRITKYLTKSNVLWKMSQCELVASVIIKFKEGKGQTLKVIDEVRPILITSTEPPLEIEVTLEDMEDIGPEYTYYHTGSIVNQREEEIKVDGKDATLTVRDTGMGTMIRLRYEMNRIRARWALGTESELCVLLGALLEEVGKHVNFKHVPKPIPEEASEKVEDSTEPPDWFEDS